ncbi:Glucosaminidase domain-containing protein [Candidatus Bealeia paramacronuclearis]|uniref:Glucosaminidase domain-containing protein n=1 Tax=Candidatus Bealeia paramacronuclearis TaxID=1921001 RepID=A0ABZ2C2X8_9PROT|nr:Glucosaminidase domain-containing protein [Candidatus Bealeia paramacronuclearis]
MPKIALNPKSKLRYISLGFLGSLVVLSYAVALFFKPTAHHSAPDIASQTPKTSHVMPLGSRFAMGLPAPRKEMAFVEMETSTEMCQAFDQCGFELSKVASGEDSVPRIYLTKLPGDLKGLPPKHKRDAFIKSILPLVLEVNEEIRADREKLLALQGRIEKGGHLRSQDRTWLRYVASEYKSKSHDIKVLLKHVDEIPPSLALSQAIIESGWGTSKAAKDKNSTFGHMASHSKVKSFKSLHHGVKSYAGNLNRHPAYKGFREARAKMRKSEGKICGHKLASHLIKYSVRGAAYTKELQNLINRLELHHFDAAHVRLKP